MAPESKNSAPFSHMSSLKPSFDVDQSNFAGTIGNIHNDLCRPYSLRMGQLGTLIRQECQPIPLNTNDYLWPSSVAKRWKTLNQPKSYFELGLLSWNVNGRLGLRGCRESLLTRWSKRGFVDVVLVEEHFKGGDDDPLYLFGIDWWSFSSGATSDGSGRKSGGCAVLGQPCLSSKGGFQQPGGRICGLFISSGLVLNIYFPSRSIGQTISDYRNYFTSFVDELINFTEEKIRSKAVSWLVCGTDTNAHFNGPTTLLETRMTLRLSKCENS